MTVDHKFNNDESIQGCIHDLQIEKVPKFESLLQKLSCIINNYMTMQRKFNGKGKN